MAHLLSCNFFFKRVISPNFFLITKSKCNILQSIFLSGAKELARFMIVMSDQDKGEAQQRYRGTMEVQNVPDIGAGILDPKQRGIHTGQISNVPCSVMGERNKLF